MSEAPPRATRCGASSVLRNVLRDRPFSVSGRPGGIRVPLLLLCFAHRVEVGHADLNQLGDLTHTLLSRLLGVEAGGVLGHVGMKPLV